MSEIRVGEVVGGDFRVVRPLKQGGMGAVYVAEQVSTGEQRALKVMHASLPGMSSPERVEKYRARFLDEARKSANIRSAHVVKVVASGLDAASGAPWLAMELLHGRDLDAVLQSRPVLPPAEVSEIFAQVGHALGAAHRAGVLHLDLKPENLFVAEPESPGVPFTIKVLDFGIGRFLQESRQSVTATTAIGSPLWMCPEQATQAHVSTASDVWPLGLIAFRCLTGRHYWMTAPRDDGAFNATAWIVEVMTSPIEPASVRAGALGVASLLPPGFDAWFARCVDRDRTARFSDVGECVSSLRALLASAPQTMPLVVPPVTPPMFVANVQTPTAALGAAPQSPIGFTVALPSPTHTGGATTGISPTVVKWGAFVSVGVAALVVVAIGARTVFSTEVPSPGPQQNQPEQPRVLGPPIVNVPPSLPRVQPPMDEGIDRAPPPPRSDGLRYGRVDLGSGDTLGGEGNIDARRVAMILRGQLIGIRSCYERALRNNPTLQGRLEVRFTINPAGRVSSASPSGLSAAPEVGTCVANRIRGLVFPQPEGGSVDFCFPFTFTPE